jgi:hypothetical protein
MRVPSSTTQHCTAVYLELLLELNNHLLLPPYNPCLLHALRHTVLVFAEQGVAICVSAELCRVCQHTAGGCACSAGPRGLLCACTLQLLQLLLLVLLLLLL